MKLTAELRSIVASLLGVLVTTACASAVILAAPFSARVAIRIAHAWGRICLRLVGARLETEGMEHVDPESQYVIMVNHESALDICSLFAALPPQLDLRFLAKQSLFSIPFLGWAMRALRFIPVNREEASTAATTLNATIKQIEHRGSPVVFPEQTWTRDGRLLPFQRGGFLVAIRTHLPILPIGLEGPRLLLPPTSRRPKAGTITVRIGAPVLTANLKVSCRRNLTDQVRQTIDRLRGPTGHLSDLEESGNESTDSSGLHA